MRITNEERDVLNAISDLVGSGIIPFTALKSVCSSYSKPIDVYLKAKKNAGIPGIQRIIDTKQEEIKLLEEDIAYTKQEIDKRKAWVASVIGLEETKDDCYVGCIKDLRMWASILEESIKPFEEALESKKAQIKIMKKELQKYLSREKFEKI